VLLSGERTPPVIKGSLFGTRQIKSRPVPGMEPWDCIDEVFSGS
jgi:hypothetical protein